MGRTWKDRVEEYVDSPRMVQRIRSGSLLVVRIHGTQGAYHVQWNTKGRKGACTCPSDASPCKHVEALRETWRVHPESFADVDALLNIALKGRTREQLVDVIRSMILVSPSALTALGAMGFEDSLDFEED